MQLCYNLNRVFFFLFIQTENKLFLFFIGMPSSYTMYAASHIIQNRFTFLLFVRAVFQVKIFRWCVAVFLFRVIKYLLRRRRRNSQKKSPMQNRNNNLPKKSEITFRRSHRNGFFYNTKKISGNEEVWKSDACAFTFAQISNAIHFNCIFNVCHKVLLNTMQLALFSLCQCCCLCVFVVMSKCAKVESHVYLLLFSFFRF